MSTSAKVDSQSFGSLRELELLAGALTYPSVDGDVELHYRGAIREVCASAAERPEMPERLLVVFKTLLFDAANRARIPPGPKRNDLLARMATIFIEEFYALQTPHGDGEDGYHEEG